MKVASALARRGFVKGDFLSLFGENCIENAPIVFGAIAAGATVHLVKPLAPANELRHYFNLVRPKIIVTTVGAVADVINNSIEENGHKSVIYVIGGDVEGCYRAEDLLEDSGDANPWGRVDIDPLKDVALMMQTGGTTGLSKIVMITHDAAMQAVEQYASSLEPKPPGDDLCLGYIPFNYVFSFILFYGAWLRLGCAVVNINSFNSEVHLKAIEKHKVTRMVFTPAALMNLMACSSFEKTDLSSILTVRCGGAAMSGESEKQLFTPFAKVAKNADFAQVSLNVHRLINNLQSELLCSSTSIRKEKFACYDFNCQFFITGLRNDRNMRRSHLHSSKIRPQIQTQVGDCGGAEIRCRTPNRQL